MSEFAKCYQTEKFGQLVVMRDSNDEGAPTLSIYFRAPGLDVSKFAIGWEDTDEGWDSRDEAFDRFDQSHAEKLMESNSVVLGMFETDEG